MPDQGPKTYSIANIAVITLVGLLSYATILAFPALLGGLVRAYNFSDADIGLIGSAELIGVTLGALTMAAQNGDKIRKWLYISAFLGVIGNVSAGLSDQVLTVALSLWVVGISAGLGGGFCYKMAGRSTFTARMVGVLQVSQLTFGMLNFQVIKLIIPMVSIAGVFYIYAILASVLILIGKVVVLDKPTDEELGQKLWSPPPKNAIFILAAFWFFCCAEVGLFAFLERIGVSRGFAIADVLNALSGFSIGGIISSLAITLVPRAWPRSLILMAALTVGELAVYGLFNANEIFLFALACGALGIFFLFTIPIILEGVSEIDRTGRSTSLALTIASTGQAAGPIIVGALAVEFSFAAAGYFAATMFAVAIVGVIACFRMTKKGEATLSKLRT